MTRRLHSDYSMSFQNVAVILNQFQQITQFRNYSIYGLVDSTMAKALFLGVVSLGCFAPDWCSSSVTMLTVIIDLP